MFRKNVRTMDELGRIILPLDFRRRLDWEYGDEIAVCLDEKDGVIILKLVKKSGKSEN